MQSSPPIRVTVAVVTYRRPEACRRLLEALAAQTWSADGLAAAACEVVVVDNDADGSARGATLAVRASLACDLRYEIESARGVAPARNRALAAARGSLLVFLDDDQLVEPGFLQSLMTAWERCGAGRLGAVLACEWDYEVEPPAWLRRARIYPPRRFPDGTPVDRRHRRFGTGGLLLDLARVRALSLAFDARNTMKGGIDTGFYIDATLAGERFVHIASAPVRELLPARRATLAYATRYWFRLALRFPDMERRLALAEGRKPRPGALLAAVNVVRLAVLTAALPLVAALDRARAARLTIVGAKAAGKILGVAGVSRRHLH